MNNGSFFHSLIQEPSKTGVSQLVAKNEHLLAWKPLSGNENNFGAIESQQASPVAALIEKVKNSIDTILMRNCLEARIRPTPTSACFLSLLAIIQESQKLIRVVKNESVIWNYNTCLQEGI